MKATALGLLLTLLSLSVLTVAGTPAGTPLSAQLEAAVAAAGLPRDSLSLMVTAEHGAQPHPVLDLNAHRPLIPASVTKLVTAAGVLRHTPLGSRFTTQLRSTAPIIDGVLNGDLIIQGGGDPSLVSETLWLLVNQLAQTGIDAIAGDIVVDDNYFDAVYHHPSRDLQPSDMAYDAPVGALSFNWNSVALTVYPGAAAGAPTRVHADPASDFIALRNSATTTVGHRVDRLQASRIAGVDGSGDTLVVSGTIGVDARPFEGYRNISQPALWTGANLKLYLNYRGIDSRGTVRHGTTPQASRLLAKIAGRPVEQLVSDMNKTSSNFIAAMLTKQLAAQPALPGNLTDGLAQLDNYLISLGIERSEFQLRNPSGLTRQNRLSAAALVAVLNDMASDFQLASEFMVSLPIAGTDGTLKNRMIHPPARGWVRAKTGYIDGVVSLAGYAANPAGERYAFAFIYNGAAPAQRVRALFDQLATLLVAH